MKFGAQLEAFGDGDLAARLALAKRLGCEGLEVNLSVGKLGPGGSVAPLLVEAARLRATFRQAGLECIALTPGIGLPAARDPAAVRAACEAAAALGTRQLRLFSAPYVRWGGPGSRLPPGFEDYDGSRDARYWLRRNADELQALLEHAAGHDVRFVFELHHGYVVNSASAAMRLLESHPPDRVGVIMDPGNMVFEGNEGWRYSVQLMGEYLAYVHCKNAAYVRENSHWVHRWASLPEGIASYPELVTALKDIGFGGYLCVEDLRRELSVEERVGDGLRYLRGLAASGERVMPT